jgi:hypothetical protein
VATFSDRKSKALAVFILCVVMTVCFGTLYFVGELERSTNTFAKFMAMIDEQHADMKSLISRISAERLEYSAAYEKCVALLVREFGLYKVVNGQIIFQLQPTADSYNDAAAKMAAAASRLKELDAERTTLKQSQLDRWKNLISR